MKKILFILILLVINILFIGCSRDNEYLFKKEDKIFVLTGATNNPKSSSHYKGLEVFKKLVEERSKGKIKVNLYSDSILGDEEQMAEGMKDGTVEVMMAATSKYANFVPEIDIYSCPYVFNSWEHFKAVMESEVNKKIGKIILERTGDIYVGSFTDGVRNVFSRKEIKTLDDLKGIRMRTMTGPNETNTWKLFGSVPVPLAYPELYENLETGYIDAAENTMTSILGMKFYENCKYIIRTEHSYQALPFLISGRRLKELPIDLQNIVLQAGKDTCQQNIDSAIKQDIENENVLVRDYGVKINELNSNDKKQIPDIVMPIQDENAKKIRMESELEKIRFIGEKYK